MCRAVLSGQRFDVTSTGKVVLRAEEKDFFRLSLNPSATVDGDVTRARVGMESSGADASHPTPVPWFPTAA